jgi:hypothetical protein
MKAEKPIAELAVPTQLRTEFRCDRCGHKTAVDFSDPEAYAERDPLPNKNAWVREQALLAAQARLEKRAQAAMRLVRCPGCKTRDAAAVRRALLRAALPLIGVAPGLFMVGVIATSLLFPALSRARVIVPVLVGALILVVASPLIALRRRRKMLGESDAALRFLPPAS